MCRVQRQWNCDHSNTLLSVSQPGCLATELEPDSELERVFDGDEGGGDDAHGEYIDGMVADALGDGEMGVSPGAHGGAGF